MRFIDKAWYRSFQMGMNIGSRALYWRKPILVSGEGSSKNIAPLLKEHDVSRVMVVTGRHVGKSLAPAILESRYRILPFQRGRGEPLHDHCVQDPRSIP